MKYIYIILLVVAVISRAEGVNENDATFKLLKKLQGYMEIQATSTNMDIATILRTFEYLRGRLDNLDGSLSDITRNIEEMDQKFTIKFTEMDQKFTDAELRDESLKEQISSMKEEMDQKFTGIVDRISSLETTLKISQNSIATDIKASIAGTATEITQGCESHLESLNTTLGEFFTDNEIQIGNLQTLLPADCQAVLHSGRRQSGVYKIFPVGMPDGVNVYCDQESDGGGWIVFVQRQKQTSQVDFARTFEDYAKGFGEPGQEFWLGNRILHAITGNSNYELRAEATNVAGETRQATWATFSVGSEDTQFTLTVDDYDVSQSTLGDGMSKKGQWQSNQMKFSTYDKDNERGCSSAAGRVGWWFHGCTGALPTAPSIGESRSPWGIYWWYWEKNSSSWDYTFLSWVQMKIRAQ